MGKLFTASAARRLTIAAALAAVCFVAAEVALRAAGIGGPVWHHPDPLLGWALRPWAGSHGGARFGQVNAFGQRDREHSLDKRPGVYRIAVLGDERSEALGLRVRDTWWGQLGRELDGCGFAPGEKIEVLNFGVAGYSTVQESLVLEIAAMRFRPDLVLLQLSPAKDIRENSRALATRLDRPFASLDEHGRLRFDASFLKNHDFASRSQFRHELAREIADRSRVLQFIARASPIDPAHAGKGAVLALGPPSDPRWGAAWQATEALLERMKEFAGRNGAQFAMVGAPHRVERNTTYEDERLTAFGTRHGVRYIALASEMAKGVRELYGAGGQWTVAGHRSAAQAVAAALCRSSARSPG